MFNPKIFEKELSDFIKKKFKISEIINELKGEVFVKRTIPEVNKNLLMELLLNESKPSSSLVFNMAFDFNYLKSIKNKNPTNFI